MTKTNILFLVFSIAISLSCTHIEAQTNSKGEDCIELIKEYSHYWIKDNQGKNGFRDLFGKKYFQDCNLNGYSWGLIAKHLGKPNYTVKGEKFILYRYRLNNFTKDLGAPGNLFLEIFVSDGKITKFRVLDVDG